MPCRRIHLLIVAAMLMVFGIVLPSHAPMHAASDAGGNAGHPSNHDRSGGDGATHHKHACPVCQIASHLSSAPPAIPVCTFAPATVGLLVIDPSRPDAVHTRAAYHGRAPPRV